MSSPARALPPPWCEGDAQGSPRPGEGIDYHRGVWRLDEALVERLYARAGAKRWQLPVDAFASFLLASAQRGFEGEPPSPRELERHLESLHLEDLALACACAEGIESAWDEFVVRCRPALYRAADALDRTGAAREVADSLYAELFGLRSRDGVRQSHLRYFHGRSSLTTWLRAVLAQRYVDHKRQSARLAPLPDAERHDSAPSEPSAAPGAAALRYVEILRRVMAAVIAALPARDRLRLRCYYAQHLTLAHIGRLLGESEATTSRSLARTRRTIREQVEHRLHVEEKMDQAEIDECFAAVVEDPATLDLSELLPEASQDDETAGGEKSPDRAILARKNARQDRSITE
jgi:RNA polymerase sigma-70 factor (ECF subfamily)